MEAAVLILDVYQILGVGPVPVGRVESGTLRPGMVLDLGGRALTVKRIEKHHQATPLAVAGDNVGISFIEAGEADLPSLKALVKLRVRFIERGPGTPMPPAQPAQD